MYRDVEKLGPLDGRCRAVDQMRQQGRKPMHRDSPFRRIESDRGEPKEANL
jgi:hypothetical protein